MAKDDQTSEKGLAALSTDALKTYATELGLDPPKRIARADLLRRVRDRRELLLGLDRQAMLDIVVWARMPVRRSASKEHLAKLIASIDQMRFDGLSHPGLVALARLRDIDVADDHPDADIIAKLKKRAGVWGALRRGRRRAMGWAIERAIEGRSPDQEEYQFLPEDPTSREPRLREEVESHGVVRGLAGRLRNVADDYIAEKLDEIERRIDQKMDQIDDRLAEWRDREVANRLRIIKITLVASVVVALLSLGYKYISSRVGPETPTSQPAQGQSSSADHAPGIAEAAAHPWPPACREGLAKRTDHASKTLKALRESDPVGQPDRPRV